MARPTNPNPTIIRFKYGLNENQVPDLDECTSGYNFDLGVDQDWATARKPFDLKGTAPNAASINGFVQLVKRDATQTTLVCAGANVYLWDGAASWTSKGTVTSGSLLRGVYWSLGDYTIITDVAKLTVLQKWDGTTLANATTGLGGTALYAKYGVEYQNRVWLFNVKTTTDTPHLMVASKFEDPQTYDITNRGGPATLGGATFTTGTEAFYMVSPDLRPINGACVFQNTLIISTEGGKVFQLTGSSAKDYSWIDFFDGSPSVGNESLANIGNDVVFMRQGGHINLLSATQNFGNARTDELTRWLNQTIKGLTGVNQIVYDIKNQKVLFFIAGKILVCFKDLLARDRYLLRDSHSPWSVYTTYHPNAFNTSAALFMYSPGTTSYSVYWGDSTGNVFDLNGTGTTDSGTYPIPFLRKTRALDPELYEMLLKRTYPYMHRMLTGRVQYRRVGSNQLTVSIDWNDEYNTESCLLFLKGPPVGDTGLYFGGPNYFGGLFYFNTGTSFAGKVSSYEFSPAGRGPGFFLSLSGDISGSFQVDHIELDHVEA
jgi:hypothetical protein